MTRTGMTESYRTKLVVKVYILMRISFYEFCGLFYLRNSSVLHIWFME
jgi:hypothetical protein